MIPSSGSAPQFLSKPTPFVHLFIAFGTNSWHLFFHVLPMTWQKSILFFYIVPRKISSCSSLFWKNFFMTLWNTCYYKVRRTTALTLKKKTSESKDKKMTNDIISHSLEVRRSVFLKLWIPHDLNFIFKYRGDSVVR